MKLQEPFDGLRANGMLPIPTVRAELVEAPQIYSLPVYLAMIASCTDLGQA